ncbi:Protein of unknown function [Flaviramulus basaltis]|uniref:DUF2971 domain-containing protein n=1 Tax=Flaviramulus basaltis TaxID=369401 RepID=A0A1K2ITW4_9FLAO|nr:DUF2971 domain-containing protein [Flaviramulus basaltis]SFZ95179.1 Protein of unknown function [Flaviramulus basaltis]
MKKEIDSYNKTLFYEGENAKVSLKVDLPKKLYKYYSLSNYSFKNLKDKKIHFSHPYDLNDLMDGSLWLWDLNSFYEEYSKDVKNPLTFQEIQKDIYQNHSNEYYKHRGVLCLTNSFNNKLFWPHYTSEQGFCIEFNSQEFLNSFGKEEYMIFPISYEPLKQIKFNDYIIKTIKNKKAEINANLPLLYALSFKDEIWEYENEWRILLKKDNLGELSHPLNTIGDLKYNLENKEIQKRNIPYNSKSIAKIILSTLFFNKNRFNFQVISKNKTIFHFRKKYTSDNSLLIGFLEEIKDEFNDKIYQLDRVFDPESSSFANKILFKIKIIELDFDKLIIERKKL